MHRIDTKTAQKDKFGAGKNGFTRGNPQTGTPATDLDDDYFDMLQEELCSVVEASGASLEKARHDQLLTALRALLLSRKNPFGDIKSDGTVKTALENLGFGERLLEADGYFELPGGLLLQWGHGSIQATNATVRFKKPFNVTPFIVLPHKITTDGRYVTSANYTLTSFSLYGWNGNGTV
ncbi:gp53-like domain-containing protein, partial [Escherichia coli]